MNEFRLDPESLAFTLVTRKVNGCKACKEKGKEVSSVAFGNGFVRAYEVKDDVQPSKYELSGEFFKSSNADGYEEVIIDNENHENNFNKYGVEEVEKLLEIITERLKELLPNRENELEPYKLGQNLIITRPISEHGYFNLLLLQIPNKESKNCFECESIKNVSNREVYRTENFLVYVPFAPKTDFELVIAPKKHISFKACDSILLFDLAAIIKRTFAAIDNKLTWAIMQSSHGHFKIKIFREKIDAYGLLGINKVNVSPDILAKEIRDSKKYDS